MVSPHAAPASRRTVRWIHALWVRALTVFVLAAATPGTADAVQEALSLVTGIECCDGDCGPCDSDACPSSCLHCACCAHATALPVGFAAMMLHAVQQPLTFGARGVDLFRPGYRTLPFRPPTA